MADISWVDYVIIGIVALSALISLVRGFVRETVSLLIWIGAFVVAWTYFRELAVYLSEWIEAPSLQLGAAFVLLLLAVLMLGGVVGFLIGQLVDKTGLTGTDRLLGMLFGAARGAVLVAILVVLAGLTPFPQDAWWRESALIPHFQNLALWLLSLLPPDVADYFHFV
jgi:membrane protein required for colicin V production